MNEEFSSPSPSPASAPKDALRELQADVDLLNKTMTAALFILLLIAVGLVFAMRRQMLNVREDLTMVRPTITQAIEQYQKEEKPKVKTFLINLQNYSKAHPDYAPIFSKYATVLAPVMQESAPAAATPEPAAPTLK